MVNLSFHVCWNLLSTLLITHPIFIRLSSFQILISSLIFFFSNTHPFTRFSSFCSPRFGSAKVEKLFVFPNFYFNLIWWTFRVNFVAFAPQFPCLNQRLSTSISTPLSFAFLWTQPPFGSGCKDENLNLNLEMFFNIFSIFHFQLSSLTQWTNPLSL
jgi:hypothetical protein